MRTDPLAYLGAELDALRQQGLYRRLRILDGRQEATSSFDGRTVVNLSSNNYLGLTTHPKLIERAIQATKDYGVGSGAVRTIAGTMAIHMELERRLAAFKKAEAVVVFQSGLRGERRHRLRDSDQRRRDHFRRAESRQHHRRLPAQPGGDQSLSAQGRRRPRARSCRTCRRRSASCSSPTASSAWTATSARCRACARSPRNSAAS